MFISANKGQFLLNTHHIVSVEHSHQGELLAEVRDGNVFTLDGDFVEISNILTEGRYDKKDDGQQTLPNM